MILENGVSYSSTPDWMRWLIDLGMLWREKAEGRRTISLVSMPCDSSAAGLITLGATLRNFCDPLASEAEGHHKALISYAEQYLSACASCSLEKCDPALKRCGYVYEATGKLVHKTKLKSKALISASTDISNNLLALQIPGRGKNGPVTNFLTKDGVLDWHVQGHPPVAAHARCDELLSESYQRIKPEIDFVNDNFAQSYLGLCLAGRTMGASATKERCSEISYVGDEGLVSLTDLLALHGWAGTNQIVRGCFYNSRTGDIFPPSAMPGHVVVDGASALLKALSEQIFQRSHIICVVNRLANEDDILDLGEKLSNLRQWYSPQIDFLVADNHPIPKGISLTSLVKSD
jgi:hypothetical protein